MTSHSHLWMYAFLLLAIAALQIEGTFQFTVPIAVTTQAGIDRGSPFANVAWNSGVLTARKLQALLDSHILHV